MALILIEKKIFDQATLKLEEILKEVPESDKVRFYLGAVYEETRQDEKAIQQFKMIPKDSQYFAEAVVHAAYLLKGTGRAAEALVVIEEGIKSKKGQAQPQMYAMHASLLDEQGEHAKAESTLTSALAQFPENAQLRFYYGTVQDRLGNKEKTIQEMQKVVELDPNHVQGLNYLAFTFAEMNKNLIEAEKLARRATHLDPQDGYVLDTLGWILYKQNKTSEAIKYLEAARKFQPTVSIIAEHLGDAYLKVSLTDRAIEMYNKAIENETDAKKKDELRLKLSAIENQRLAPDLNSRVPASTRDER
jgi:tetratricopeptide (TPR) repeat protein